MGVVFKQGMWGSMMMYLGVLLGYLNFAVLFPNYFQPEDLGLRSVILDFCSVAGAISLLGTNSTIIKFLPKYDQSSKRGVFFLLIGIIVFIGLITSTSLIYLFTDELKDAYREKSPLFISYSYLVLPWVVMMMLNILWDALMVYNLKVTYASLVRDVYLRLGVTVLIIAYANAWIQISTFWKSYLVLYFTSFLILFVISLLKKYLSISFSFTKLKQLPVTEIVSYSLLLSVTSVVNVMIIKLDVLMLGSLSERGLLDVGVYVLGVFIISLIEIPKRAIHQVSMPVVSRAFERNDLVEVSKLYKKTSINQIIVGSMLFALIWLNIEYIYDIIPKSSVFREGKWVVLVIGAAKLIDMACGINGNILVVSARYKQNFMIVATTLVLSGGLNYVFIPKWGIVGAAVATLFTYSFLNVMRSIFVYYYYKIQPFGFASILALLIPLVGYGVASLLPVFTNPFVGIILNSVVFVMIFIPAVLGLRVSNDINAFVQDLYTKYVKR